MLTCVLGEEIGGPMWSGAWVAEPLGLVALTVSLVLYVAGCRRLASAGGHTGWGRIATFVVGWGLLAAAIVSPLHRAGVWSVAAHMAQHTVLVLAPLAMIGGKFGPRAIQGIPPRHRPRLLSLVRKLPFGRLSNLGVTVLMLGTVVFWHLPPMFELASDIHVLHTIEHVTLVAVSFLFWGRMFSPGVLRAERGGAGAALMAITVLFIAGAVAGALLTFATVPWYPRHSGRAVVAGIDWLVDQQLAGILMSVPKGLVLIGLAASIGRRWVAPAGWEVAEVSPPSTV